MGRGRSLAVEEVDSARLFGGEMQAGAGNGGSRFSGCKLAGATRCAVLITVESIMCPATVSCALDACHVPK